MVLPERNGCTLESIAQRAGFSSGIHLSHEFRKHVGQTPGQYRKQFRVLGRAPLE